MNLHRPIYFRHGNIVKAYDTIIKYSDDSNTCEKRRQILEQYMEQIMMSTAAMYLYVYRSAVI